MSLQRTVYVLTNIFEELMATSSTLDKRAIVNAIEPDIRADFEFCLEILDGKHKLGYTFMEDIETKFPYATRYVDDTKTFREYMQPLWIPITEHDLSTENCMLAMTRCITYANLVEPIVNRRLRLGIGKSLLPKDKLTPMLAKKYDGILLPDEYGYFVTEKLDGNRCIAHYDGIKWNFTSRSGKAMHVNFDMSGMRHDMIYDGEVLSPEQVELSKNIHSFVHGGPKIQHDVSFNVTSGLINSHTKDKQLIYNVFDVMEDVPYIERRICLDKLKPESKDVRILPILHFSNDNLATMQIDTILNLVNDAGGEGLIINKGSAYYQQKRTNDLLKYKPVYTMDMIVTDVEYGTGKYEYDIGALIAECITDDGKHIQCKIGTGLSDEQRSDWASEPADIIGKIVEVGYFSLSQNAHTENSCDYSLRFPRLKSVRRDKNITSEY